MDLHRTPNIPRGVFMVWSRRFLVPAIFGLAIFVAYSPRVEAQKGHSSHSSHAPSGGHSSHAPSGGHSSHAPSSGSMSRGTAHSSSPSVHHSSPSGHYNNSYYR